MGFKKDGKATSLGVVKIPVEIKEEKTVEIKEEKVAVKNEK